MPLARALYTHDSPIEIIAPALSFAGMSVAQGQLSEAAHHPGAHNFFEERVMNNVIYIVGLVVVVGAVLSFLGLH